MELSNLPSDIKRKIALELDPADLIQLCTTSTEYNKDICNSNDFWRLKLQRDFPIRFNLLTKQGFTFINPKATYMREFLFMSVEIDKFLNDINIADDDKKSVFKKIYSEIELLSKNYDIMFPERFIRWINREIFEEKDKYILKYDKMAYKFVFTILRKVQERLGL